MNRKIKTFKEKIEKALSEGYKNIISLRTSNYGKRCYSFTLLQSLLNDCNEAERLGIKTHNFHLNRDGIWENKENQPDIENHTNIHLYDLDKIL